MTDTDTRSTRVIAFSGKQIDWPVWSEKFLARGRRRGYKKILTGAEKVPADKTVIDTSTPAGKEQERIQEANEDAYEDLILSINAVDEVGRVAFQMVKSSKTNDLKDGDARMAWEKLEKKYQPKTTPSRLDLGEEFSNLKVKTWKSDPDIWISKLDDLRIRINEAGGNRTEMDVMEHVLTHMPKDYNELYVTLHRRIGSSNDPLTIDELKEELTLFWKRLKKQRGVNNQDETSGEETALFAGGFSGNCNHCGKIGHKSKDCWSKQNSEKKGKPDTKSNFTKSNFTGKCHFCGKKGHRKQDCWKLNKKDDKANLAKEDDDDEIGFISIDTGIENYDFNFDADTDEIALMSIENISSNENLNDDDDNNKKNPNVARMPKNESLESFENDNDEEKSIEENDQDLKLPAKRKIEEEDMRYDTQEEMSSESDEDDVRELETPFEELFPEQEGPHNVRFGAFTETELGFSGFYLGMTYYEWEYLPDVQDDPQPSIAGRWVDARYYREPCDQMEDVRKLRGWREQQLLRIRTMTYKELCLWKMRYQHNLRRIAGPVWLDGPPVNHIDAEDDEFALPMMEKTVIKDTHTFIGDSGASCHMVHSEKGMFDVTSANENVTIGNGHKIAVTKVGKLRATYIPKEGKEQKIVLHQVKVIPELAPYNLFSLTAALDNDFKIGNEGKQIYLVKGNFKLKFDREIKTRGGYVAGAKIVPREEELNTTNMANPALTRGQKMSIKRFHDMFGHQSVETTKITAKYYGIDLTGTMDACESCILGKARQKNVGKGNEEKRETEPGKRLFFDVSSIKNVSYGGSKFWLLVVDDATDCCFSFFLKKKSDVPETMVRMIKQLQSKENITVMTLRCDNAGENKTTDILCQDEKLGITFEYTAPDTPQHNGRVERKFATLYGRMRAMLNAAGLEATLRKGVWAECGNAATRNENLSISTRNQKPAWERFFNRPSKLVWNLRTFGEMAITTKHNKIQGKLTNKGIPVMFVGYASDHATDVYRLLKMSNKRIVMSRDVRWLNKSYKI